MLLYTMNIEESSTANKKYWQRLRILSERTTRDFLSGLLNRGTATQYIENCLKTMPRDESCALFIIDLDNFKQVNDSLGYQAGDRVIQQAASLLSRCFRVTDIVGRLGGDEFFALLAGHVTRDMVEMRAKSICESLQFPIDSSNELRITPSVGVSIAKAGISFKKLYARADASLFEAKKGGRNRYFISDDSTILEQLEPGAAAVPDLPVSIHTLLSNMNEGVALVDMTDSMRVLYASPALSRFLNLDGTCAFPCPLQSIMQVHPDNEMDFEHLLHEGLHGDKVLECELRVTPKGSHDWRWCRIKMVRDKSSMLLFVTDISASKNILASVADGQEILRLVLSQRDRFIWTVDLYTRTFRLFNTRHRFHTSGISMKNFPDCLVERGWVHPSSVAKYRKFASELLQGNATGGCALALRNKMSKSYRWFSLFYHLLPETLDRPPRVIGVLEPLACMYSQEGLLVTETLWEDLRPSLILYLHANLSTNHINSLWREGKNFCNTTISYSQLIERSKSLLFFPEEARIFAQEFCREFLLEAFSSGRFWITRELRRVDSGGNIRWCSYTILLSPLPETEDVHAFLFIQNTDVRHEWERALPGGCTSPEAGLYDRKTAGALAAIAMESTSSSASQAFYGLQALVVLQFDACEDCCDTLSGGDKGLVAIVGTLFAGAECIVGDLGESRLSFFLPRVLSRVQLRQQLDKVIDFVRKTLARTHTQHPIRFVCAVLCDSLIGADYATLLAHGEKICSAWHDSPDDEIIYYTRAQAESGHQMLDPDLDQTTSPVRVPVPAGRNELEHKERIDSFIYDCLDAIIMADSPEKATEDILARIGNHFCADRVYLMTMPVDSRHVVVTSEWCSEHKGSIRSFVSGMRIDSLPLVKTCLEKDRALFVNRSNMQDPQGTTERFISSETGEHVWNYAIFPLHMQGKEPAHGFLCLENMNRGEKDVSDLKRLLPYLVRISQKYTIFMDSQNASLDALTGILNINAYKSRVHKLTSDKFSSMGVLALDVPNLDTSDGTHCKTSAQALVHISGILMTIFDRKYIFRTKMSEFIMFCPNTTQDVFLGRVLRAQSVLQRRYQKTLRIGYTWAEGFFFGERLVREARAIMLSAEEMPSLRLGGQDAGNPQDWQKNFVVYLQPKVDMQSGRVFSAEALVRGLDSDGKMISPLQFIEAMEKMGSIRELDLFVLKEVLEYLDSCRQKKVKPLPMSVNFSRITFFNPSTPGAVLAILSRYPDVDPGLIEIEITETAGDVESSTLERTMDHFRQLGLHFALDDFGSRYANFSMFANIRFDTVKLDRSLTREMSYNPVCRSLVGNIVRICSNQGMQCVAEGVETQAQVDVLLEEGCSLAQGFFYNRPIPMQEFWQKYQIQSV